MTTKSFKSRVNEFWKWYSDVGPRFFRTIEAGNCKDLLHEVSPVVEELFPGFAWVFGPGPNEVGGHSFTLSGSGSIHFQFLAEYWKAQAPELEGWTFHASRQPNGADPVAAIRIDETKFVFGETQFTANVNNEKEKVDLEVFNPSFANVESEVRVEVTFLILDYILGEYGTEQWVGIIDTTTELNEAARSILKLPDLLHDLEIKHQWKKLPPTESGTVYECEGEEGFARSDTLFGSTVNMTLIQEYLSSRGQMENPIEATGADFLFAEFATSNVPQGSEVEFRSQIIDSIEEELQASQLGISLGGAFGFNNTYLDFLLFDTDLAVPIIRRHLEKQDLEGGCAIHAFASESNFSSIVF